MIYKMLLFVILLIALVAAYVGMSLLTAELLDLKKTVPEKIAVFLWPITWLVFGYIMLFVIFSKRRTSVDEDYA